MKSPLTALPFVAPLRHNLCFRPRGVRGAFRVSRFFTLVTLVSISGKQSVSAAVAPAAMLANGVIEGRVVHAISGNSLNNARVTVRGTSIETTTDEVGTYRLA